MKINISIKTRIIVLLSILISLASVLLILLMTNIINDVTVSSMSKQLISTVKDNVEEIEYVDGNLSFTDEFDFHSNGVSLLIYSENKTLLAGQLPVGFNHDLPFENGVVKTNITEKNKYLLVDFLNSFNFVHNYWVRGIIELPNSYHTSSNIVRVSLISIPIFLLVISIGTVLILNNSFKPLTHIIKTINSISDTKDLSLRINTESHAKEFNTLKITYNNMFDRLEKSYIREKRFISDASHELRTPISVIQSACEYSEKYEDTFEEKTETLFMIKKQTLKIRSLMEQLLNISRIEQGDVRLNIQKLDLSALVKAISANYHITITPKDQLYVNADKELITILIQNLIENAIKYGNDSEVTVSVYSQQDEVILVVKDGGIGISEEDLSKIWDRFYRADASRSSAGSGLGLSIVKRIIDLHDGFIHVESKINEGTKFFVHLKKIS